jgi:hypothetical protein
MEARNASFIDTLFPFVFQFVPFIFKRHESAERENVLVVTLIAIEL